VVIATPAEVREKFRRVKPLKNISVTQHGWTVAAFGRKPPYSLRRSAETPLRCRLVSEGRAPRDPNFSGQSGKMGRRGTPPSDSFTTADAYAFERELGQLHPDNRNIKAKIRQQLQELRDRNLLLHVGRNCWRLP
jgi:hypothetical protein